MDNLVVAGYRLGHVSSDFSHFWTWRCGSLCRCVRLQLQPLAYLWRRDQAELLREIISSGLQALLIKVAAYGGWQAGLEQSSYQWGFIVRNEWMMHVYSALLCIAVLPKRFTIISGLSSTTTSVQHPLGWCDGCHRTTAPVHSPHTSYRWRGERVIETIKCMRSPHTSYRWRGERVIEPIKCMRSPHTSYRWRGERHRANQVYGDY